MSRIGIYIVAIIGIPLFILSFFRIDVFTYKDTNKLERIVMTTKEENLTEQYPAYPEGMAKDERLQYKEGVGGLGMYAVNQVKDRLKAKKEEDGANGVSPSQQANVPHRPHSVGKPTVEETSGNSAGISAEISYGEIILAGLGEPEAVEVDASPATGMLAETDVMHGNYVPEVNMQRISRLYKSETSILTGSFSVDPLRPEHLNRKELKEDLLNVVAQFDLLAVQGIYTQDSKIFLSITRELSMRTGRPYRHVACIPSGVVSRNRPVPVFFYDADALEMDPTTLKLVCRPNEPFTFPPLAVKFRVKKAPAEKAFTFIAVNLQTYPNFELQELSHVPRLIASLKDDSASEILNREDDVILFGYFGVEPRQTVVADARFNETLTWANPDCPTNTFGTFSYVAENILFQTDPLSEYQDSSGIWDLRRQFKRANKIPFDHHPVWACFSTHEGGLATP
ncbi:MAG: hypothetical protein Q4C70_06640 [Planctomycetia bacterium]|nr:hypothetical protein [Planctomycetia bacterium]